MISKGYVLMVDSLHNILTIVNSQTNCENAINKALLLTQKTNAQLTILNIDNKLLEQLSNKHTKTAESLKEELTHCYQRAQQEGYKVKIKNVHSWQEYKSVLQELNANHYDLVIKERESHHHNYFGIAPSEDWHLLRDTTTPVLLVTSKAWQSNGHILSAIETENDELEHQYLNSKILDSSAQLSNLLGCEEHIVSCYLGENAVISFKYDEKRMSEREKHWEHLVSIASSNGNKRPLLHLKCGLPDDEIPALANKYGVNIVILGAAEHNNLLHNISGHTSEYIIDNLDYDVLAIKPTHPTAH